MSRHICKPLALLLIVLVVATGCHPTQPFYLHEDGDLSHLIETATDMDFPDVETAGLADARNAHQPYTLENPDFDEFWDISLEECVAIALQNTKFVRAVNQTELLLSQAGRNLGVNGAGSIYLPAITETDPNSGVPRALAAFDAQLATSLFWDVTDRPLNRAPQQGVRLTSVRNLATWRTEVSKRAATGTQMFFRTNIIHEDANNSSNIFDRPLRTAWETNVETEIRHPLLRGNGTQVNRATVMIARINTDIAIAEFEANIRDLVFDVERAYWGLYCGYRQLETAKVGRDSALATWKRLAPGKGEITSAQDEANARARYFAFRALLESSLAGTGTDNTVLNRSSDTPGLFESERRLRHLLGIAPTDGRLIRPSDEPTLAKVAFTWHEVLTEALIRDPNLRQQKWSIKQRELELMRARNNLLPQLDAVGLYRWLGLGDRFNDANPDGADFPDVGSSAVDGLLEGNFQEARVGLQLTMPVGFRAELAGVRNAQLRLARDHAALDEMELDVSHLMTQTIRGTKTKWQLAQTNFNRWKAAFDEVNSLEPLVENGLQPVDLLLDALQRRAEAQIDFYTSVCDYNISIASVHRRKGSLLEYNNVMLAEGPWPKKAYWDAMGRARERDASYFLNYGWTRPKVISRGAVPQQTGGMLSLPPGERIESVEEIQTPATPSGMPPEAMPVPGERMMTPLRDAIPEPPNSLNQPNGNMGASSESGAARRGFAGAIRMTKSSGVRPVAARQEVPSEHSAFGRMGLTTRVSGGERAAEPGSALRGAVGTGVSAHRTSRADLSTSTTRPANPLRNASHEAPLR